MTEQQRKEIAEILDRRANEIAMFCTEYRNKPDHFGSVELALTREIERLRCLSFAVANDGIADA